MARVTSQGVKLSECITYTINGRSDLRNGDKIPFNTIYTKSNKSDSFKLDGNDVLFLKDCKVLVSATICCYINGTALWLRVNLNKDIISTLITNMTSEQYQTLSLTPKMITVKANDRLSISIVSTTDYVMIGSNLGNTDAVFLTIQKID